QRSTRRQLQAAATRSDILDAAETLFLERGYAATSVDAIAGAANVARATVFLACGSKVEILKSLRDLRLVGDDEPIPMLDRPWFREALEATNRDDVLRLHARNMRIICDREAGIERVLASAADVEPALRELYNEAHQQRAAGMRLIVEAAAAGGTDPIADIETFATAVYALSGPEVYELLVRRSGWSSDHYEKWLAATLIRQCADSAACGGSAT
ncbi:TetR/AcrR family transcriptional regulator, partial [Nocardia altamirensis]|uniref:TetR/AcrR family transcriptional regulator n=1 Tax=Nocardia altamirensis TaxID=472158 RepID=UPI0008407DA9